jgi:competence protein ComEC
MLVAGFVLLTGHSGPALPRPGETVVSFLDVGQGDSTLVQRDGSSMLVDTGPPDGPVLERLAEAGVRRLDMLVLTHAQADHEGAGIAVVRRLRPGLIVNGGAGWASEVQRRLPAEAAAVDARVIAVARGDVLRMGALEAKVLWPPQALAEAPPQGDANNRALVMHVRSGAFDLLLTADAETDVTGALPLPKVDALKVAHHGSADAGLPAFLSRTRPAVAAIEVGRGNSYGHPTPSTLAALRSVPTVRRTDRDGTVRLHAGPDGALRVETTGGGLR